MICFQKVSMVDVVILAGGNGSRMQSSAPKIFQEIAGRPCVSYIIDECKKISNLGKIIVVTKKEFSDSKYFAKITLAIQEKPLGTADAAKCALPFVQSESVIVLNADTPLITLKTLLNLQIFPQKISLIAMKIPREIIDMPYGRIDGKKIIEYKDATDRQKKIDIVNTGVYKFQTKLLTENIKNVTCDNKGREYYLTDMLNFASPEDIKIHISDNYWEFHGINTMKDLADTERHMQQRLREKALKSGVKMLDPNSVYFSAETNIENDVVVEENVIFKGNVEIKSGSIIKAFSYIEDSTIMSNVQIGPFARIRGGSLISSSSEIGNFVEVKRTVIGKESKAKHLSYIGDANVGEKVNIGAGVITCNYDGFKKHKTNIGDGTMIGANCSLVAPVNIGNGTIVAAGSTITEDTQENTLAIARSRQENKINGALKTRKQKNS